MGRFLQASFVVLVATALFLALKEEPAACGLLPDASGELVLWSRRVVTHQGTLSAAIHIRDGKFASISLAEKLPEGAIDYGDYVISPGLVDLHVHMNEPGREEWEGFETGTKSAAAGGITTVVDQPLNCFPTVTSKEIFDAKLAASKGKLWVDTAFWGGLVPTNAANATALGELLSTGVVGLKAFLSPSGIADFAQTAPSDLALALPVLRAAGNKPLMVHAELPPKDPPPVPEGSDPRDHSTWLASRPRAWEQAAIAAVARLAGRHVPIHIAHVSDADSLPIIVEAKRAGKLLTAETCPHYLSFTAEGVPRGDTRYKCAPPIRESENRERLWDALLAADTANEGAGGGLDFVASDHSPAAPELKLMEEGDFMRAWGGIASLQLGLPAVWTGARERGATLDQVAQWWSARAAAVVGLAGSKGRIQVGLDADLVVWDPDASLVVGSKGGYDLHHRHKVTPYEGRKLFGRVRATFLRGQMVFDEGRGLAERACGAPVLVRPGAVVAPAADS